MDTKPPFTYEQQLEKLKSRGCAIGDEDATIQILKEINYYRLSAYFLPFKRTDDTYSNVTFDRIFRIYEFDRLLRRILFSALEEIEISFKARLAYYFAHKYGATEYLNPTIFNTQHKHEKFLKNFQREVDANSRNPFVMHHMENYNSKFPIWVATELFTFGMASKFYADLPLGDQKIFAKENYCSVPKVIRSVLRCCTDLRNICAHYGRLYFRTFSAVPNIRGISENSSRTLWAAIFAMKTLCADKKKWRNETVAPLEKLVQKYRNDIELKHIGFPDNWESLI